MSSAESQKVVRFIKRAVLLIVGFAIGALLIFFVGDFLEDNIFSRVGSDGLESFLGLSSGQRRLLLFGSLEVILVVIFLALRRRAPYFAYGVLSSGIFPVVLLFLG